MRLCDGSSEANLRLALRAQAAPSRRRARARLGPRLQAAQEGEVGGAVVRGGAGRGLGGSRRRRVPAGLVQAHVQPAALPGPDRT